jgi:putative transcription factor
MCGNEVEQLARVRVEGSILSLCNNCQKFGTLVDPPPEAPEPVSFTRAPTASPPRVVRASRTEERDVFTDMPELQLAPDWGQRLRLAREKLGWTPEELGKKLNEKKSVILKMESGHFHPPDATVRRIEQALKVRLRADPATAE